MAKPKKVLDYDPLAWLEESAAEEEQQSVVAAEEDKAGLESQADQVVDSTDDSPLPAAQEEPPAITTQAEDPGYGFFDDVAGELQTQAAEVDESGNQIDLGAELTIRSVASCKSLIDEMIHRDEPLTVHVGQLQKIDCAGLQLLHSLKMTMEKNHRSIQWTGSADLVNQAADELGLSAITDGEKAEDTSEEDAGFGFF